MNEASNLSLNVVGGNRPRSTVGPQVTLDKLIEFIKSHQFDEYTTKGLIDLASTYPNNALTSFKKNFNLMVQRIRAKRKVDQNFPEKEPHVEAKEKRTEETFIGTNLEDAFRNAFVSNDPS